MMRRMIAWSMQLRLLMVAAAAVLLFFGVTELRQMPLDVVPEFTLPRVEIQSEALGLSAAEVEAMVTVPLEADMLNGAPWVKQLRSESIPGLSSIVLEFEPGTDLLVARQMAHERLVGAFALPGVSKPPVMLQPISSTSRFLKIGVTSDARSLIELSVLSRWTIAPRLMGVPGVANVSIWGNRGKQLQVHVDPAKLHAAGVTLHQVIETSGNALWASPLTFLNASTPGTGGWIETPNQRLGIQHLQPISEPEDLSKVTVEGTYLALADVATVVEDHQPLIGDAVVEDGAALMLVVEKLPWASTVEVTRDVEAAVESLKLGLPGVQMDTTLFRPATYLELASEGLSRTLLVAFALVVVALLGLLSHWRLALISGLAVALSACAAGTVLYLQGVNLNMMLIAGLMVALGAIIDDAVIDVQNAARRLREPRKGDESGATVIFDAVAAMRSPIVYATLIAVLSVAPLFFLEGVWGSLTRPIAVAYAIAILASMLVALTATPALCLLLLRDAALPERESLVVQALRGAFDGLVARSTGAAGAGTLTAVAALGAVVLAALIRFPASEQDLLPNFRERDILVELEGSPGTSDTEMTRIVSRASRELRAIPGVRNVSAHVGRAIMSDRVTDVDSSELWVSIDRTADYDRTLAAIQETVAGYPGLDIDVDTYLTERIRDEAEIDDDFVVRVYGDDLDTLARKAEEVRQVLARVDGVVDPEVEYESMHPTLEIRVDMERSKHYGLKPGDVRRAATTLLSGIEVGSLFEEQKVFEVVVWGTPEVRESLSDIENLLIDAPPRPGQIIGDQVPLKEVADLRIASAPRVIHREAVARHLDVVAQLHGRSASAVASEAEERIRSGVEFPLEFRAEVMGSYQERIAAGNQVRAFAVAAAIAIVLLLQAAFRSWSLAGLFLLTLPVATLGGALVWLAGGAPISLGVVLGLLAVFTLAARNGLVLVWHYRQLEKELGEETSPELVLRGTRERLAPIAMSAIATALALLPFALSGGSAGHEILQPMATVALGGLVTSTLVTLLVVPSLYLRFGAGAEPAVLVEEEPPRLIA
jgi:CzcA family heavy metal efflux pump